MHAALLLPQLVASYECLFNVLNRGKCSYVALKFLPSITANNQTHNDFFVLCLIQGYCIMQWVVMECKAHVTTICFRFVYEVKVQSKKFMNRIRLQNFHCISTVLTFIQTDLTLREVCHCNVAKIKLQKPTFHEQKKSYFSDTHISLS